MTQPAGLSRRRRCGSGRQTRAGLLRRKRSLVRRLPRGGVGELVVLGDCVRLAGQKAGVVASSSPACRAATHRARHATASAAQLADPLRRARTHHHSAASVQRSVRRRRHRSLRRRLARSAAGRPHRRHPHLGGSSHSETTWTTPSRSRARNDPRPDRSTAVPPLNDFPCPCQAIRSLELTSCRSARLVRWLPRSGDQPGLRWIQASGSTPWTP